jgi:hypothetical protein
MHTLVEHMLRLSLLDKDSDRETNPMARYRLEELYTMQGVVS